MSATLELAEISKSYDHIEYVIKGLDCTLEAGTVTAITGRNGSGKSTLLKMMTGLSAPTSGKITYKENGQKAELNKVSFVAPYYNLYEDYTPLELYKLVCTLRGENPNIQEFDSYLAKFELKSKKNIQIKNFSSGMKQRLKIILNLIGDFQAYFFDEPSSNLDVFGIETLEQEIENLKIKGKLVVIASNEPKEISWCNNFIKL